MFESLVIWTVLKDQGLVYEEAKRSKHLKIENCEGSFYQKNNSFLWFFFFVMKQEMYSRYKVPGEEWLTKKFLMG